MISSFFPISILSFFLVGGIITKTTMSAADTKRARDWDLPVAGIPGALNAITDVSGVLVGHATIIKGHGSLVIGEGPVRTGVTAILPTGFRHRPVFAATGKLNGNGEMTGTAWVDESGFLEEPILLTNTHAVGLVYDAVIQWRAARHFHSGKKGDYSWASLPVVAETWDGRLNDIHGGHVTKQDVFEALDSASAGLPREGNVGGGTGMVCYRFKGGIGTSSRKTANGWTLGVLVQANYGRREDLTIGGMNIGAVLQDRMPVMNSLNPRFEGNSIIVIVATNAPLLPHQLKRIVDRVPLGIGRLGGIGANSSGDLFLAFTTHKTTQNDTDERVQRAEYLSNGELDPLFVATIQATEESILNALVAAETMTGINDNKVFALPTEQVKSILKGLPDKN